MQPNKPIHCVLFDLDGTLLDTAPDLIAALNRSLAMEGLPEATAESVRPFISFGASAMIRQSLGSLHEEQLQNRLLTAMLADYQSNIACETKFFDGMDHTIEQLEAKEYKWGIVTNKLKTFTQPLIEALDLTTRLACLISGDTTRHSKPHPAPMLAACKQAQVEPQHCLYIGDSAHDMEAGKSVGMQTLAASYGYLKPNEDPADWGADALINQPHDILSWLETKNPSK